MPKKTTAKRHRRSLKDIYIHHIVWGSVCLVLIFTVVGMWFYSQGLSSKAVSLQQRVTALSGISPTCEARDTWKANSTKTFAITTNDGKRSYDVHLPKDFDKNRYYPMVLHYPGKGMTASDGEKVSNFDALPVIGVYPHPSLSTDGYWAWQGAPYSSGVDDVSFTGLVLSKVQSQLCIDRSRIYATGLSNGGGFVSLLACKLPGQFAAFGIVSGAMYYPSSGCTPPQPTPLINIHGDSDTVVPYNGSIRRNLPSIETWVAARASQNGCSTIPTTTYSDAKTVVTSWQFCKNNATVQNIRINGGGHVWSKSTTDTLWNFMSWYRL